MRMRVLVIGGAGFIGFPLVRRLLAAGHEIAVFHRRVPEQPTAPLPPSIQHFLGDRHQLLDHVQAFRRFRPDVVVDMICYTERDAHSLTAAFRGLTGRLVLISSGDVYRAYGVFTGLEEGPPEPTPIREDDPLRKVLYPYRAWAKSGEDKYDYEKILVERIVRNESELPATVLRLPMVYGPGDYQHRISGYLRRMLDGRPAILLDEGMARWRCLRGYVEDVAEAIALAAASTIAAGRVYNVAEPFAYTETEWVGKIAAVVGWKGNILAVPKGKLSKIGNTDQDLVVDSSRIRSELGFKEVVNPDEALRETIEWERNNPAEPPVDYPSEDALLAEMARRIS
jgi:nucleoside-diphosphate-sugar epimerase